MNKRPFDQFTILDLDHCVYNLIFCLYQSLSGHTSGIDSVSFDSSEVLVAAGAASGTIKLWDLEEAKSMLLISISDFL